MLAAHFLVQVGIKMVGGAFYYSLPTSCYLMDGDQAPLALGRYINLKIACELSTVKQSHGAKDCDIVN